MVLKMFALGHIITIVELLTFLQCKVRAASIENAAEIVESMESALRVERSLYPEHAFLAGELTTVFLAHEVSENHKMVYERLESGIVNKALDYFKSTNFHGLPRSRRSVDENINLIEESQLIPHLNPSKRDTNEEFYYPSLLVVMEHQNKWPSNKQDQDKLIYEKILYALTYWHSVDNQLRRIRHPGVRIRITGFVIGRDKDATPATVKKQSALGIRLYETLKASLLYWQGLRGNNPNFPKGAFNVVATMIDSSTLVGTGHGFSIASPVCGSYEQLNRLTGLIVHDEQDFRDIGHAVAEIAHIMGRPKTGSGASSDARSFSDHDLEAIKRGLQRASCKKEPLEVYPPGKPLEALLREDVLPH